MDNVRWGIIGCGEVCEIKSGPAFQQADGSNLVAVMRRDGNLAADYARRHHVKKWYDDAQKLIDDPELRANITKKAKNHLRENGWIGPYQTLWHRWLLEALWKKRHRLDCYSKERITQEMSKREVKKHGADLK